MAITLYKESSHEEFDTIIIAAGSFPEKIFRDSPYLFDSVQPMFYGIGSALDIRIDSVNAQLIKGT